MFDRKAHWEKIYSDRDPPGLSWCRKEPALSLPLISNARLALDVPLIDIGGRPLCWWITCARRVIPTSRSWISPRVHSPVHGSGSAKRQATLNGSKQI
jgi:hypothetical protein